jgi:hypothetical protein
VRRAEHSGPRRPARAAQRRGAGRNPPQPPHPLVGLVTRLVVAQTGLAAAIGLLYSRRHLPSILITLMLVAALCGLVMVVRSGTQAAWMSAIGFETTFILFGLFRFFTSRYLGGTLFAIMTVGALLHPAVAAAFSGEPARAERGLRESGLADAGDGALEGGAAS